MGSYGGKTPTEFDFIVVGGGTAGNVVAGRLAENPNVKIAVIEAGPGNTREIDMITTPARAMETRNSKYDWGFKATMVDRPEYTRVERPHTRGKVLGGCSCLNYFTWVRGSHGSYDDWSKFGGDLWNWNQCEPYFDKPAHYHDDSHQYNPAIAKIGRKGPLDVSISDMVSELETFRQAYSRAWVSKGEHLTDNVYEGQQRGLVKCVNTIYKGVRSTSVCFLDGHSNITIIPEMEVLKVLLRENPLTAYGIEALDNSGTKVILTAKREVIMSAGVFHSPKLMMLSGVGPKEQLEYYKIKCLLDSKHVGQNLLDHPIFPHVFKLKDGCGLDGTLLKAGEEMAAAKQEYLKNHSGPYKSGLLELVGFPRIDKRLEGYQAYRKAKEANGGLDPFGPDGQ